MTYGRGFLSGLDDPVGAGCRGVVGRPAACFAEKQQLTVQADRALSVDAVSVALAGVGRVLIRTGVSGRDAPATVDGDQRAVEHRVPPRPGLAQGLRETGAGRHRT
jgi:hypothetical protein